MDEPQINNSDFPQISKSPPIKKPLSIKILQVLFLVGGLGSSTFIIGMILGIPQIVIGWGLLRYTEHSLTIARRFIGVLLAIIGGVSFFVGYGLTFQDLSLIQAAIVIRLGVDAVISFFALYKIQKILKQT